MTSENDIVLIYYEDDPIAFARVESILPDHKRDWYHVKLLILKLPLQPVTWILRTAYINGTEFTMDGKRMRIEKIVCPEEAPPVETKPEPKKETSKGSEKTKVISFPGRKKT
ncbi:MAG: hypothetical protein BWK80_15110 [Desulfobacteraceae bacterium IS3]|nr:MAG: hypothetical protein BWK80_15110 [Desulfobacteraceae bacterium IS3]HAO22181.1 hypothetical protein [Desulfobacteraceae bacterium]